MEFVLKKYNLSFKLVREEDAEFIIDLRTSSIKSKYISKTSKDISIQEKWIKEYIRRELKNIEFYFIIYDEYNIPFATYRIYNITKETAEIGSFITKENYHHPLNATKVDIAMKEYVFEKLGYNQLNFEIRKENISVIKYHKIFNPQIINEDDLNYYFIQKRIEFDSNKDKIKKLFNYENIRN